MDDMIKRSDAINLCGKWRNRTNEHHDKNGWYIADTLLKAIKELPSADRPQDDDFKNFKVIQQMETVDKWIPIDERFPEPGKYVLLSFANFTLAEVGRYEVDDDGGGAFFLGDDDRSCSSYGIFVNAWMPLPEPWKGADDE